MSALAALASEQTPIGEQVLVPGVQPITPTERLAMLANLPPSEGRQPRVAIPAARATGPASTAPSYAPEAGPHKPRSK